MLGEYDGKRDLDEHMQLANDRLNYFSADEASKGKLFALTLVGPTRIWCNGLPNGSIGSWTDFSKWFSAHFTSQKRKHVQKLL